MLNTLGNAQLLGSPPFKHPTHSQAKVSYLDEILPSKDLGHLSGRVILAMTAKRTSLRASISRMPMLPKATSG